MPSKKKVPLIEGLFTFPGDTHLLVSRCKKCGSLYFPKAAFCLNPDCENKLENIEVIELSKTGKLYSFTHQLYQPPPPFRYEPFQPFALGIVDFPEGLRVWGIINKTENLEIGMTMETAAGKLYEDEKYQYLTWMWQPAAEK